MSVSFCILIISNILCYSYVIEWILRRIEDAGDSRAKTVTHLLISGIGLVKWFMIIYYILALFGVDTKTIVTSMGLGALGLSMGARDVIADMLAGLSIILSGALRVGNLVDIGGYVGRVQAIGIRTTSVESEDLHDVRIFNNSDVKNVINLRGSVGCCDISIPASPDLNKDEIRIQSILPSLPEEFPQLTKEPEIVGLAADKTWKVRCYC